MIVPGSASPLLTTTDGGYTITKSLRFRRSASAYLNRTFNTPTNRSKWTWSAWIKRGSIGAQQGVFTGGDGTNTSGVIFNIGDTISFYEYVSSAYATNIVTAQVFRDPSAWYHLVIAYDTAQATASNRVKMYVNGVQITSFVSSIYPSQNYASGLFNAPSANANFGREDIYSNYFDGYIADTNFIDGQALTPTSFGETDILTGVWKPKSYSGTYGTNGFYLKFTDNSSATPLGLGKDFSGVSGTTVVGTSTNASTTLTVVSLTGISVGNQVTGLGIPTGTYVTALGTLSVTLSQAATSSNVSQSYTFNGNNFTCNNISVTAGATYDSMLDVPTLTDTNTANYAVLNLLMSGGTLSEANLKTVVNVQTAFSTISMSAGKFYWECKVDSAGTDMWFGVVDSAINFAPSQSANWSGSQGFHYKQNGDKNNGTNTAYGATWTTGDILACALDMDTGTIAFYKNGTSQGTAFSSNVSGRIFVAHFYAATTSTATFNFGQRPFSYTPPTGFKALNTFNLPESTIVAGNKVMDATTFTSTGTTQTVTNAGGFKPDLVWTKNRSSAGNHYLNDSVRGIANYLQSDTTNVEGTISTFVTSLNSNGFSLGTSNYANGNSIVGWQWQAGQGSSSSNTSGSITSTVSVNASAGFSVVTYTGNGTAGATVGHSLGVAPQLIFFKNRTNAVDWGVYHKSAGNTGYLGLNSTAAVSTATTTFLNSTTPSSSIITLGSGNVLNQNTINYVAYCWTEIAGFSKFSIYTGNGLTEGPFIYTGFRPKFVMVKNTSSAAGWLMYDSARNTYNVADLFFQANSSNAEATFATFDFLSNGFKVRTTDNTSNTSANNYIYMAFA
jgi:hypothetical protein